MFEVNSYLLNNQDLSVHNNALLKIKGNQSPRRSRRTRRTTFQLRNPLFVPFVSFVVKIIYRNIEQVRSFKIDKLLKSQKAPVFVIPAKAGIQENHPLIDSRLRGSDGLADFLRVHLNLNLMVTVQSSPRNFRQRLRSGVRVYSRPIASNHPSIRSNIPHS